ncbi:SDR family oxidoreductase/polysaccharide deacetylase family protein [Aspergillus novofumigatus IBT 16806]|uniref:Polysaccharide deacetylase family protein n=1 Tax=Aspergillus novofumigatus (strain IBT 16806) TaxID=1392255 RepID=A0A2I1C888_ASPN1|nr:polysaccharide deacetylase family protein [Aspergillus novofumigatus IBT 16806]PKX93801.1 polysaccharide deacetylase family protein [Aspergillus novofumigatus IBT 16806]
MSGELSPSFLGLEGLHVFITGAAGGIGQRAVQEFLDQGCKVTAYDLRAFEAPDTIGESYARLNVQRGDISDEESIRSGIALAVKRFGPINILIANASITDESHDYPIWELPLETWEKTYSVNVRGTFLTIKHFLRAARTAQQTLGRELENLAIVVMGSETGVFGQEGHAEYASGKAGLQYGLVKSVKNEIVRLNSRARINAVAPGWVDTPMIEGRLDDLKELWAEAQATVPLKKIAKPEDVARTMAFLASHRAAGHITGQCLSVDGGMEGRLLWKESNPSTPETTSLAAKQSIPRSLPPPKRNKIRVAVSIDLDAVSGWLGTGHHPDNILADYSAGFFAAKVGVPRLLRMLKKLNIADRCTWFIPGHSAESFPEEVAQVVASGAEIGLHGYAHEGAYQMTPQQERDVLVKCIDIATKLTGKKPAGYRAPLYQLRESTLDLLEEFGFEYDASLTDHDCHPFFAPRRPALQPIDFSQPASTWMHPIPASTPANEDRRPLVCVPCNWYMEDMTPMQFLPHAPNSHGYTDVRVIENLWRDRFLWIRENEEEPIFPVLMHPDTSGMAHVIGMVERLLGWVEFCQTGEIARWFRERNANAT